MVAATEAGSYSLWMQWLKLWLQWLQPLVAMAADSWRCCSSLLSLQLDSLGTVNANSGSTGYSLWVQLLQPQIQWLDPLSAVTGALGQWLQTLSSLVETLMTSNPVGLEGDNV
jgi:hypothetical protein